MEHKLTFHWTGGSTSAADHMKETFKAAGIPWQYSAGMALQADLDGSGFVSVDYYQIEGDTFGIIEKPPRTSEYFGIPAEKLYQEQPDADGYTREDYLVLDHTEETLPFAGNLLAAVEKADRYRRAGYEDITIFEAVCALDWYRYYVLATHYNPARRTNW